MLAQAYRFHGHNAVQFAYKKGKTVRTSLCLLRYAPNARRKHSRVAVVVSKKLHKSAVVRNRIRRRFYEVIRQEGIGEWPPHDLVFTVVDVRTETLPEKDIKETILRLLQMSGVKQGPVDK
jgi:ribonuclease P protein component